MILAEIIDEQGKEGDVAVLGLPNLGEAVKETMSDLCH